MFHIKNSKCISHISARSLKQNRTRNIAAILAIVLTTLLFTGLFTIVGSMMKTMQDETCRQIGTSTHAGFKYLTWEQYEKLAADDEVKDISYNVLIGFGENAELDGMQTEIRYTESKAAEWGFSLPTTGRLPESSREAAVSDEVLKALGLPCELGAEFSLEFSVRGEKHKEAFSVCGIWEQDKANKAAQIYLSEDYMQEVAPMWHEGDTYVKSSPDADEMGGCVNAVLWFDSSRNIEVKIEALKERCGFDESVHSGVNWAYESSDLDAQNILLVAGFLLIIGISGYLIIYNIFYISVSGDIRFYGLLKTIGTTNRQLAKIVKRQALLLSAAGIPIGLLLGYVVGVLLLPKVMQTTSFADTYVSSANPYIFIGSALFALVTVYMGCLKPCCFVKKISPVEAVRYTENADYGLGTPRKAKAGKTAKNARNTKSAKCTKHTKPVTPLRMAYQNMKRGRKKTAAVIISLSLSLILLNTAVSIADGFDMDKYLENYAVSDFCVTNSAIVNASGIDGDACLITAKTRNNLESFGGISETGYVYFSEAIHKPDDEVLAKAKSFYEKYKSEMSKDIQSLYEEILAKKYMYAHIYGAEGIAESKLELLGGEFDREKFESGDYVIVTGFSDTGEERYYDIGDVVTIDFGNGKHKTYEVMAIGDIPYALGPQHSHLLDIYFTLPASEYIRQTGDKNALSAAFNVQSDAESEFEKQIAEYCENESSELTYVSKATYAEEFEGLRQSYLLIGAVFSFILALIGILNFVNAFVTSAQARKKELAVLQSVGMTGKQLCKMLIGEGFCYIALTAALVLSLGTLATYALIKAFTAQMWMFTYHFVIWPIFAALPLLLLAAVCVPAICYSILKRKSIVERLRTE